MKTIVLIHGAFLTPDSWQNFKVFFEKRGYHVLAPAWPYHDQSVATQRAHPNKQLGKIGLNELVSHYAAIINELDEPPILIGHSFGGLLVQLLLDKNFGSLGIALDPGAPKGVISALYPTTFRSVASILLRPWKTISLPSQKNFNYAFVHTLPPTEQEVIYNRYVVPETSKIFFQAGLSPLFPHSAAKVNYAKQNRVPLLLIAGALDHIAPKKMVKKNYTLYHTHSKSRVDFLEFPNRTHWLMNQQGWEEIAESIDKWIRNIE